jgi:hypothetical protein
MNIKECVDFINFWIRKERGAFYTIEESVSVIDRGQIAYYNDIILKYAASQIIKDTLMPFKETYTFTTTPSIPQLVVIPEQFLLFARATTAPSSGTTITMATTAGIQIGNVVVVTSGAGQFQPGTKVTKILNASTFEVDIAPITTIGTGDAISFYDEKLYLDLLDITIQYTASGRDVYYSVKMTNEDEIGDRLNSQINPPLETAPVGQMVAARTIQLFPSNRVYTGFITYMRRPKKPVYGYSIVGGRSIVYDPSSSVQLEWKDSDINFILLKGLASIGINLSDQEVSQFAELKSQENYQGVNHL